MGELEYTLKKIKKDLWVIGDILLFLVGIYFTVNITFSDASCNQLIVLTAEINDDYFFLIH